MIIKKPRFKDIFFWFCFVFFYWKFQIISLVFFIFLPVFTDHRPLFRSLSWELKLCPELECKEIISNSKLQRLVIASFSAPVFPCEIKVSSFPALLVLLCRACFVMKKMESCLSWTDDNIPLDDAVSSNAFFFLVCVWFDQPKNFSFSKESKMFSFFHFH